MVDWPTFSDEDRGGRVGVNLVGLKIHKELRWIFRETTSSDLGIDGEVEVRQPDKTSHGRIIAVQIKCGSSFLREKRKAGYVYRGSLMHLGYWSNYTAPVAVMLCDPETETCWWRAIAIQDAELHERGWSIEVPFANVLSADSVEALATLANRFQKKDLVELLLRDWLGWSFEHRIRIASLFAVPRDYHWFSMLAVVDDEFLMIDYVMSRGVDGFDAVEVDEMTRWAKYNHDLFGYGRFLLVFVSEHPDLLASLPEPARVRGVRVEYVPLLLDLRGQPKLSEVGEGGRLIAFYEQGDPLDDCGRSLRRAVRRSP